MVRMKGEMINKKIKGYIPSAVSDIAAKIVAIPLSAMILLGLWMYKIIKNHRREKGSR